MREQIRSPRHDRVCSLGWLACAWMEALCVHGPGDIQGDDVALDDELAGFTVDCYVLDGRGRRLYDSAFLSRAKGRDKSGHAARFGLFEALGPSRFVGFAEGGETYSLLGFTYAFRSGEPMGAPVTYPFIRCMATEEGQTGNVYDAIYYNLTQGRLAELGVDAGVTRTILPDGGEIVPSTASSAAKDGGKETWTGFDETHLYITLELRRMYNMVRRNMGKRKQAEPWSLETSTMYAPGENSVAEATHKLAEQIRRGRIRRPRLLFDHRDGPDVDLSQAKPLRAALAEAYGPAAAWMDLQRLIDECQDPRNDEADSKRHFLNRKATARAMAVPAEKWDPLAVARKVEDRVAFGFDGSFSDDTTALVGCTADGHLFVPVFDGEPTIWERPVNASDWRVPRLRIERAVEVMFETYDVGLLLGDPPKWQTELERWAERYTDGNDQPRVVLFDTNQPRRMSVACDRFSTAIAESVLSHDGNPLLRSHVVAMVRKKAYVKTADETDGRTRYVFTKGEDGRKIDAGIAAVLALEAAMTMPEKALSRSPLAAWV